MGMDRNITLVRGIKVEYSATNIEDLDALDYPDGVYWYGNGEYDTDYVIIGSRFVDVCDIQGSVDIGEKAFSTENDGKIYNFCRGVLKMPVSADIKNWAVADFS